MHITIHTSQTWADTFISELNDTHVEAELRTRNIPPLVRTPGGATIADCCQAAVGHSLGDGAEMPPDWWSSAVTWHDVQVLSCAL